jgi:hypothetical protein
MNDLAQNNLTLRISKNDLAAATSWLTFGGSPMAWGTRRSGLTQATESPTAHARCENAVARRPNRNRFQSDRPLLGGASRRSHRCARGLRSGGSAADPALT